MNEVTSRDLESLADRVARLEILFADREWQSLPYSTGWADFSINHEPGEYRKIGDQVQVRGLVKRTSGSLLTIATLPTGYRPTKAVNRDCLQHNDTTMRVQIRTTGVIEMFDVTGSFTWVTVDLEFSVL